MSFYRFKLNRRIYRKGYFVATFVVVAFIVGCVNGYQEQSRNNSFLVATDKTHANTTQNIHDLTSADQNWHKGDIVYVANGYTDHMGMIDSRAYVANNSPDIIDSDDDGAIRRHNNLDKWADQGGWSLIEGYYVTTGQSDPAERSIANNKFNIGDIYNAQTEITLVPKLYKRNSPSNTHSSQLVRHAYKYLYNIDLDADGGWWSWPKDIRQNPNLKAIPGALFVRS